MSGHSRETKAALAEKSELRRQEYARKEAIALRLHQDGVAKSLIVKQARLSWADVCRIVAEAEGRS